MRVNSSASSAVNGLDAVAWPGARLGEALACLAQQSGLLMMPDEASPSPKLSNWDEAALEQWIVTRAQQLGLEAEPTQATYAEATRLLQGAGPALLRVAVQGNLGAPCFLALLRSHRQWVYLIAPDRSVQRLRLSVVQDALWADIVNPHLAVLEPVLAEVGVAVRRRMQTQQAILAELLGATPLRGCWLLRLSPGSPLRMQWQQANLARTLIVLIASYSGQLLLSLLAWWMIGRGALSGEFAWSWLLSWALTLLTTLPLQLLTSLTQRQLVMHVGELFKVRLLYGVLQLQPEEIRHQGAGQFLGRVLAADMVEQLALAGGFVTVLAVIQLGVAVAILALGSWITALCLLGWCLIMVGLGWRYGQANLARTLTHRTMTNDLVERMVGHRTRLVQEDHASWHNAEDLALERYVRLQAREDQAKNLLQAYGPRGWLVLGLAGFVYTLLSSQPTSAQLAISLGGLLLAFQAISSMTLGVQSLADARSAWVEVSALFQAATRSQPNGGGQGPFDRATAPLNASKPESQADPVPPAGLARQAHPPQPLLTTQALAFRYHDHARYILQDCNLRIYPGERLLLEGPSGGGKSTLAALVAGLRTPSSGVLTLGGHDWRAVNVAAWRRQVVIVPQFHENYVLTGTLAFNLLLGRRWPPTAEELAAAEAICRELGLSDLLARMPAGLQQMVGESGWRLSHGERSRVYIARALLQGADLMILDESFAALDPENLRLALQCVLRHAPTLLVIAHP